MNVTTVNTTDTMAFGHPGWTPGQRQALSCLACWTQAHAFTVSIGPPPISLARDGPRYAGAPCFEGSLRSLPLVAWRLRRGFTLGLDARPRTRVPPRPVDRGAGGALPPAQRPGRGRP